MVLKVLLGSKHPPTVLAPRRALYLLLDAVELEFVPVGKELPTAAAGKLVCLSVHLSFMSVAAEIGGEGMAAEETLEDPFIRIFSEPMEVMLKLLLT